MKCTLQYSIIGSAVIRI